LLLPATDKKEDYDMTDQAQSKSLKEIDQLFHMHGNTSISMLNSTGPVVMDHAQGMRITDTDGNEYLDSIAGLWCMTLGYGRSEIGDVAKEVIDKLSFVHTFGNGTCEPTTLLAQKLVTMFNDTVPGASISKVFFGNSGSDANETNIKLMRLYNNLRGKPSKKKVISRTGAYHGLTTLATALTGIPAYHKAFDAPVEQVIRLSTPSYYRFHNDGETEEQFTDRLIHELKDAIAKEGADNIGAFIAEPVMGTGGMFVPPVGYFEKVQPILEENDILLIVDEVVTGFGRTGKMFGCETFGLKPDFVTLAKGLTSAYAPLSASLISSRVWDVLQNASEEYGPIMHGFTYGGHPLSTAIALKAIEILERENLVENAAEVGPYLIEQMQKATADCPYVGEVRGVGAMLGVEYVADKATRRLFDPALGAHKLVAAECTKVGLISRALPYIEVTNMAPPLIITKQDADECVERYARALDAAMPKLAEMARRS
jgi:L-2,4-diaminobutyrate transaminase